MAQNIRIKQAIADNVGSIIFSGTGGNLTEDNSNLFWDDSSNRLGIGTSTPAATIHVKSSTALTGARVLTAQNSSGTNLFDVDDNGKVAIFNTAAAWGSALSVRGLAATTSILSVIESTNNYKLFEVYNDSTYTGNGFLISIGGNHPSGYPLNYYPSATANYGNLRFGGFGAQGYQISSTLSGASYGHIAFINGAGGGFYLDQNASSQHQFYLIGSAGSPTAHLLNSDAVNNWFCVSTAQNLGVGISTPASKLDIKGSGATNATTALRVINSSSTVGLFIRDDGGFGIGQSATSLNNSTVAIGGSANAAVQDSIAIGAGASVTTTNRGIAIGAGASQLGQGVTIGWGASGNADRGVSIGYGAVSTGTGIAIGGYYSAQTTAASIGVAIGESAIAAAGGVALGFTANTTGGGLNAIGQVCQASGASSQAYGFRVKSTATEAITFGRSVDNATYLTNSTANSFAIGWSEATPSILIAKTADSYFNISGNFGIGTTTPDAKLHVSGTFKLVDGTQGLGKVLTSDADGLASWETPSGGSTPDNVTIGTNTAGELYVINGLSKYTETGSSLTGSSAYTVTHNIGTTMVQVIIWDTSTGEMLTGFLANNRTTNSVDVTVSVTGNYDIIVIG